MTDTLNSWVKNEFLFETKYGIPNFIIDSSYCINNNKTKIIGVLHISHDTKEASDGIQEFYGAKIEGKWYFWTGGFTPVARSGFKGHDQNKPLSYQQLHSLVGYGGYLDQNGNIRDQWFDVKFKGDGWGKFKDRYKYKATLDGNHINTEVEFWEYLWKKAGLMKWIMKCSNDSISKKEKITGSPLSTNEKNEIQFAIARKMIPLINQI